MIKKRYSIPALVFGLALVGGGTAFAMVPGGFDMEAFTSLSSDKQAAIQQANDIRSEAETKAQAVLDAAGVTQDEIHDAMDAYHEKQRAAFDTALDANDFDAYKSLIANSPNADKLTEETFAKLVQIRKLEKSGDREGAMELRKDLGDSGFMGPGGFGGHGPKGPRPEEAQ